MTERKNSLKDKIGRRVDRTISSNKSSLDAWVNYQFDGVAKKIGRSMKEGVEIKSYGSSSLVEKNGEKPKK